MAYTVLKFQFFPIIRLPNHCINNVKFHWTKSNPLDSQSKVLSKLMKKDRNKHWHLTFTQEQPKKTKIFEMIHRPTRRMHILNSLFMHNITEVLSTGEIGSQLLGYGIEISNVQVTYDFQYVNVLWQLSGDEDQSSEVEKILNSCSFKIRSELISRNVLGKVPHIVFFKDQAYSKVKELEKVLKTLDFVPSFKEDNSCEKPLEITDKVSKEQVTSENLTNKDEIIQLAEKEGDEISHSETVSDAPIKMRSDILGLDHTALMNQVLNKMKRSKGYLKNEGALVSNVGTLQSVEMDSLSNIPAVPFTDDFERETKFKAFLHKRNVEKLKNSKKGKKVIEFELLHSHDDEEETFEDYHDEDYFEEDINDNY